MNKLQYIWARYWPEILGLLLGIGLVLAVEAR